AGGPGRPDEPDQGGDRLDGVSARKPALKGRGPAKIEGGMPSPHGLLGRIQRANDDATRRFGPNTAEVEAFINAVAQLTPWQWRQGPATRRLVASVNKEGAGESSRSIQDAIRSSDGRMSEPMSRAGEILFDMLARKSEEK